MNSSTIVAEATERFGELSAQFRGTRDECERKFIATEYARVVEQLVDSGQWDEMPASEDQLPDDWMPKPFFDSWSPRMGP